MITRINRILLKIARHYKILSGYYNRHSFQLKWTQRALDAHSANRLNSWGHSIDSETILGDYLSIRDKMLLPNIIHKTVCEIGCLDGKWSEVIVPVADYTFLVDLSRSILPVLNEKLVPTKGKYTFYETKGYELDGIEDNSIQFIFSMDTLVRVNKNYINSYLKHFRRVLTSVDGKMLIHLPCNSSPVSRRKGFVNLSPNEIVQMLVQHDFSEFTLDFVTINHGVLIKYGF